MKRQIEVTSDLLKIKKLLRDVQQISYSSKNLENKFPDIELSTNEEMIYYIRTCLAFKYDLEDILKQFNSFLKKYG